MDNKIITVTSPLKHTLYGVKTNGEVNCNNSEAWYVIP